MKLLATADLHIRNLQDTAILARILQAAKEQNAQALLIGGDLLDRPFLESAVEDDVRRLLSGAGLPIFLVAGNHDPLAVTALYQNPPEGVYLFPEPLTGVALGENIRLWGYSAAREQGGENPLQGFSAPAGTVNILLGHAQVDGGRESFCPIASETLSASGLDLAILGHIHKCEQRRIGSCRLLVPGIPEGKGFDELGEKFVYLIDTASMQIDAISVAERIWREYPVDLSGCADEHSVLERLMAVEIPQNTVGRLILRGAPSVDPATASAIYTERTGREIKDQTDPSLSVEVLKKQNTLQGAFVRRAMAEIESADEIDRPRLEEALRLGLQALKEARL